MMKKLVLAGFICSLALALFSGVAMGQSDPCEGLQGATPGLYGLCKAFHTVEPCETSPLVFDPFAVCEPKDGRLLEEYNELKTSNDPRMPGTGDDCPCFTDTQMWDAAAQWESFGFEQCLIEVTNWAHPSPNALRLETISNIVAEDPAEEDYWGAQVAVMDMKDGPSQSQPVGRCSYSADGESQMISGLRDAEITACNEILAMVIYEYEDRCVIFCDRECP